MIPRRTTDKDYTLFFANEDGTIGQEIAIAQRYAAEPGALFLYADGTTSASEFETLQTVQTEETTYVDQGDGSYTSITYLTALDGLVEVESGTPRQRPRD